MAATVPPVIALASSQASAVPFALVGLAAAVGLIAVALLRKAFFLAALGAALAVLATTQAVSARNLLDVSAEVEAGGWPTYDLTATVFPESTPEFVQVRGFFRAEWVLDEYAVEEGEHPDQDRPAAAVLVPVMGALEGVVEMKGPIVVARVAPGRQEATGAQTLRGRVLPLEKDLLATLIQVSADVPADQVRGVLLDTRAVPKTRDAYVKVGLSLLCMVIALAAFWFAGGPPLRRQPQA